MIERVSNKSQGSVQKGLKSRVFNGFAATNQFNFFHEDEIESYKDKKVRYHEFKLPNDPQDKEEFDKMCQELSGDVKVYRIEDLKK